MKKHTAYETGRARFVYHLAVDAISTYLEHRPALNTYLEETAQEIASLTEATNADKQDWVLDAATAAANELANKVRNENGADFTGTDYSTLLSAAYDRLGIEH